MGQEKAIEILLKIAYEALTTENPNELQLQLRQEVKEDLESEKAG